MHYISPFLSSFNPFSIPIEEIKETHYSQECDSSDSILSQSSFGGDDDQKQDPITDRFSKLYRLNELSFQEDPKIPLKGQPGNPIFIAAVHQYISHPPERSNAKTAYEIAEKKWVSTYWPIIDMETLQNVGWFAENPQESNWRDTLLGSVKTMMGRVAMDCLISYPIDDLPILAKRQTMIRHLKKEECLRSALNDCYQDLFAGEQQVLSFWNSHTRLPATLDAAIAYAPKDAASWRLWGNYALNLTAIVTILARSALSTIACTTLGIVEINMLKEMVCNSESELYGESYLRGYVDHFGGYALGRKEISGFALQILMLMPNQMIPRPPLLFAMAHRNYKGFNKEISRLSRSLKLEFATYKKMMKIASFCKNLEKIYLLVSKAGSEFLDGLEHIEKLKDFIENLEVQRLLLLLKSPIYDSETLFFDRGNLLEVWKLMASNQKIRSSMENALLAIGEIDAYLAVTKKMIDGGESGKICFAEFIQQSTPFLNLEEFWHPSVSEEKVVTNSISLGSSYSQRGIILTGPNASGKSTLLRSILFSIMASQSFTVAFARSLRLTPIHYMRSSMNPEDSIQNSTSLFQAQAETIANITTDLLDVVNPRSPVFLALDELFTGTNAEEGDPLAQATLLELLEKHPNVILVAATHHPGAAKLGKARSKTKPPSLFRSYRLVYDEARPTYRLERGICARRLANVVAKQRGIPISIIKRAKEISKKKTFNLNVSRLRIKLVRDNRMFKNKK